MKKYLKILSAVLALVTVLAAFASCSTNLKTVADDGKGNRVSLAMYSLMTSLMKGDVAYYVASKYGNYNSDDFWMTVIDGDTQMTYKDYYTYIIDEKVKTYLAALTLFDENGLSLTAAETAAIDEEMSFFVSYDGGGSKNTLNGILAAYGANYDTLRDYKIMNAKIAKVSEYLYGAGGSKIESNVKQKYLDENYYAFKQIMLPTYDYVYETDKYGDDVYYKKASDGTVEKATGTDGKTYSVVAYDTVNGISVDSDKDGIDDLDECGNKIYYVADTETVHIAYDKVTGIRVVKTDDDGYEMTRKFSDEEKKAVKANAETVKGLVEKANYTGFENLITIYDDNYSAESDAARGDMYYLNKEKVYTNLTTDGALLDGICKKLSETEIGDFFMYESDYGYHIIMRFETETGAYENKNYASWFSDENGDYDFTTDLVNSLFVKKLEPYIENVKFDEDAKSGVDVSKITPNYNFY